MEQNSVPIAFVCHWGDMSVCVSVLRPRLKPQDHLSTSFKINVGISFIKHRMIWKNDTHLRKPSCALKGGWNADLSCIFSQGSYLAELKG